MKDLKFRAWLKEPKIMAEVKGSTTLENKIPYGRGRFVTEKLVKVVQNENINALWWCYERDDGKETECEIMQFIGLKDKKGKEIYEGDIVADILDGEILMVGDIQFKFGIFGVEWVDCKKNKSMVGAWGQKHNLRRLDDDIVDRIEVIGNIFQNPELLGDLK